MIRDGFVIDVQKHRIVKYVKYDDSVFDGLYVKDVNAPSKEGANILFAAYTFPIECEPQIKKALEELEQAEKTWKDTQSRIFYKTFRAIKNGESVYKV